MGSHPFPAESRVRESREVRQRLRPMRMRPFRGVEAIFQWGDPVAVDRFQKIGILQGCEDSLSLSRVGEDEGGSAVCTEERRIFLDMPEVGERDVRHPVGARKAARMAAIAGNQMTRPYRMVR